MTANELLNSVLDKINTEIESLLEDSDNDSLIGNDIEDELTVENYIEKSQEYRIAIHKLTTSGIHVKLFLEKSLIALSKLQTINPDYNINEEYKLIGVHRDALKKIYIDNNPIENKFLEDSKILIVDKMHVNLETFSEQLYEHREEDLLYLIKGCFDNFDSTLEGEIHRLLLLPNCSQEDIANYNDNKNELLSYLKLCMLAEGLTFHKHFFLDTSTSSQNLFSDRTKVYSQYNEVLYILSEYNYSNDLLNKYFLLYTIIENFMYRKPIATMLRSHDEFSIRDFKDFYSKIDSGEGSKLKDLFKEIMNIEYTPGNTVYSDIEDTLNSFKTNNGNNLSSLIIFLKKMRIYNKNFELDEAKLRGSLEEKYFAEITYQLRNSILHNTATEFHITHYELSKNEIIVNFLKDFMIPILEKIILHLIITNNDLISYEKEAMILYKP